MYFMSVTLAKVGVASSSLVSRSKILKASVERLGLFLLILNSIIIYQNFWYLKKQVNRTLHLKLVTKWWPKSDSIFLRATF